MARVYKHKKRGWQLRYLLYFQDGSQAIRYRYFHAREQATEACLEADRLEFQALRGQLTRDDVVRYIRLKLFSEQEALLIAGATAAPSPALGVLAASVLENSRVGSRQHTHVTDCGRVARLLEFFGSTTPVDQITAERIEDYVRHRHQSVSAATINKEMIKLAQILDLAQFSGAIAANPARAREKLKDARGRVPRAMTEEEIEAFMAAALDNRKALEGMAYEIFMAYLLTGLRRDELLNLKWQDVDLKRRRIVVQGDFDPNGFIPKTRKPRVIGISQQLAELLSGLPRGVYVFGGDRPIVTISGISHCFMRIRRQIGLPEDITLHSLRHSYISYLLEAGVNPRRVQDRAGHASYQTTQRYTHVLPSADVLEDSLPDFASGKPRSSRN